MTKINRLKNLILFLIVCNLFINYYIFFEILKNHSLVIYYLFYI